MAQLTQEKGFARLGGLSHMRLLVRMQERFVPAEQGIKQTSRGSVEGPGVLKSKGRFDEQGECTEPWG